MSAASSVKGYDLFRPQALEAQRQALLGRILINTPLARAIGEASATSDNRPARPTARTAHAAPAPAPRRSALHRAVGGRPCAGHVLCCASIPASCGRSPKERWCSTAPADRPALPACSADLLTEQSQREIGQNLPQAMDGLRRIKLINKLSLPIYIRGAA